MNGLDEAIPPFIGIILVLSLLGIVGYTRWADIKGTYLLNTNTLLETPGIITSSTIYSNENKYGVYYHYAISYEYSVNGEIFSSQQVTFGPDGFNSRDLALAYTNQYPVGKKIKVYYEVGNPNFAVLEPNIKDENFPVAIGFVAILLGLVLSATTMNKKQARKQRSFLR